MEPNQVEEILDRVIASAHSGPACLFAAVDQIPAPLYVTDSEGFVNHANPWCFQLTGRHLQVGKDRWCVTWKLYDLAGNFMPHEACPMADSIRQRRKIRGLLAQAERPNGTRVTFMPFPTPFFTSDGQFAGAINMLIDLTEAEQADDLRAQAARCSRLAVGVGDQQTSEALALMSMQYTLKAYAIDLKSGSLEC